MSDEEEQSIERSRGPDGRFTSGDVKGLSLREYISEHIDTLRRELKLTWDAHNREHIQHEQAHGREHEFSQKAIDTAAALAKENKADANEWRAAMNDRERTFATKVDVGTITSVLDELKESQIKRDENDRLRLISEAEEKRIVERNRVEEKADESERQRSVQWKIGLLVGVGSMLGSILINLVIRLVSVAP